MLAAERALADGCPVDTCLDGAKDVAGGDGVLPIERGDTALLAACRAAHQSHGSGSFTVILNKATDPPGPF